MIHIRVAFKGLNGLQICLMSQILNVFHHKLQESGGPYVYLPPHKTYKPLKDVSLCVLFRDARKLSTSSTLAHQGQLNFLERLAMT